MANALITLSLLANLGVAHSVSHKWPFNACEVTWDNQLLLIRMRFCDRTSQRKYLWNQDWAFAYDEGAWADGSEQEIQIHDMVLQMSIDRVHDLLDRCITDPWKVEMASRVVMAGEDVYRIVED